MSKLDLERFSPYGATLLRLVLGVIFLSHAYAKIFDFTLPGTAAFFEAYGFPGWTAYPVTALELVGGIAFLLGVRSRYIALALLPVMLGAIKPHLANGYMFTQPGGGWEFPFVVGVLLVVHAFIGAGAYALDSVIGATAGRKPWRGSVITTP